MNNLIRNKLRAHLEEMERSISEEEQIVEKMNEEKMISALNSNVKLGCLQAVFDEVHLDKTINFRLKMIFSFPVSCICIRLCYIPSK